MKDVLKSVAILATVAISFTLASCEKNQQLEKDEEVQEVTKVQPTIEIFAKALSAAVYQHGEMRSFIKDEALKQFDKDYDVFYPFVKDKEVAEGKTFREYMLDYLNDSELERIEQEHPLLTISVPDWEWLQAFSVKDWDLSDDDILVGFAVESDTHPVFFNGDFFDNLEAGMFPENPVLIVKDNERMAVLSYATKGEDLQYCFADEVFRPEPDTKVSVQTTYYYLDTHPGSEWIDASAFRHDFPEAADAWDEYGRDPYNAQRNYVYYNMRKGETTGMLNPHVVESILAIRLNNKNVMDDDSDSKLRDHTYGSAISSSDTTSLINAVWNSGQLEIKIVASTIMNTGAQKILAEKVIPVDGKDLFDISKIQRDFYHKTMISKRRYVYIGHYTDLEPKWYYLPQPLTFNHWTPESGSSIIEVHAYEVDGTQEETVSVKIKKQKGVTLGTKVGSKFELNFDSGATVYEENRSYTIKKGSDDLFSAEVYYSDYIITAATNNQYRLHVNTTGSLDFIMVPYAN